VEDMDVVTEGAATANPELAQIEAAVSRATQALLPRSVRMGISSSNSKPMFDPAEYILFQHFLGQPADAELEGKLATFIRRQQAAHDGWRCSLMAPSTSAAASRPIRTEGGWRQP